MRNIFRYRYFICMMGIGDVYQQCLHRKLLICGPQRQKSIWGCLIALAVSGIRSVFSTFPRSEKPVAQGGKKGRGPKVRMRSGVMPVDSCIADS